MVARVLISIWKDQRTSRIFIVIELVLMIKLALLDAIKINNALGYLSLDIHLPYTLDA